MNSIIIFTLFCLVAAVSSIGNITSSSVPSFGNYSFPSNFSVPSNYSVPSYSVPSNFTFPSYSTPVFSFSFPSSVPMECIQSAMQWGEWMSQCENASNPEASILDTLNIFCADSTTSNCTFSKIAEMSQQMMSACSMFIDGSIAQMMLQFMGISRAMCTQYNGQFCVVDAINLGMVVSQLTTGQITLANATAQIAQYCTPGCGDFLRQVGTQNAMLFDPETQLMFMIPSLACTEINGNNCFLTLYNYFNALASNDMQSAAALACNPCMRYIAPLAGYLEGTVIATMMLDNIPNYAASCQTNGGQSCASIVLAQAFSMGLMTTCSTGTMAECIAAIITLTSNVGCCASSLLTFIPPTSPLGRYLENMTFPAICAPAADQPHLMVKLILSNVNITILQQYWGTLQIDIEEEFANLMGILPEEVTAELVILTAKKTDQAQLQFDIAPTTTAYTADALNTQATNMITSGTLQFSALNTGTDGIATSPNGVGVSSGSSYVSSFTSSLPFSFSMPSFGSQFPVACLSAIQNFGLWVESCGAPAPDATFLDNLNTYCGTASNCSLSGIAAKATDMMNSCPFLDTSISQTILQLVGLSNALCTQVSGHFCVSDAVNLAYVLSDLPSGLISLANATAAISQYCTAGCPAALRRTGVRLSSVIDVTDELFLMIPTLACASVNGENCFLKVMQFYQSYVANNVTEAATFACHPCMKYLAAAGNYLAGTQISTLLGFLPNFGVTCQYDGTQNCLAKVAGLVKSLNVLGKCSTFGIECLNAVYSLNASAGCCVRSISSFVPTTLQAAFNNLDLCPLCSPPSDAAKLKVRLALSNINITRLQQIWASIKGSIKTEFAKLINILEADIIITLDIVNSKRTQTAYLQFEIAPTLTSYTATSLNGDVTDFINQGVLQFSSLNTGANGLATDPSGVAVSTGSSSIETTPGQSSISHSHSQPTGSSSSIVLSLISIAIASLFALLF